MRQIATPITPIEGLYECAPNPESIRILAFCGRQRPWHSPPLLMRTSMPKASVRVSMVLRGGGLDFYRVELVSRGVN